MLVGIGFMSLGVFMRSWAGWRRLGLGCCGALIALSLPIMMTYKVLVSSQGFMFGSVVHRTPVEFDAIASVRITHEGDLMSDTERSPKEVINFNMKDGGTIRFKIADNVNRAAGNEILKLAKRKRIPVTWESGTRFY
jgi:hypothetical protein